MNILGISAWYHDAAACLVRDGEIVAAAQEERFTRKKHDPEFPENAIRSCLAAAGLRVRDKPASACLSSRIPVGVEVTTDRLRSVERAENALRRLGFRQLRVRHHGEVARLELDDEGHRRLDDPDLRAAVVREVREAGFRFVALDLEGYRTGSLGSAHRQLIQRIGPVRDGGQ